MGDILFLTFVFLAAGVVAVPIASRLGLGSVLGYLLAGIAISPILALFRVDVVSIQHFAEFGVVMMLFLVGLELEPRRLWEMRSRLLGLGGLQVGLTVLLVMAAAMALGQPWTVALAAGMVLSLSSTAIVLQTLNEKGLMRSDGGSSSFAVLLSQDIAVIPMLAVIPLLATPMLAGADLTHAPGAAAEIAQSAPGAESAGDHGGSRDNAHDNMHDGAHHDEHGQAHGEAHGSGLSLVDGLAGWQQALVTVAAIAAVILGGMLLTRPVFRFIAVARLREIFVAAALLWVVSVALLMTLVGLSPALGAFLAGVVLANSEYRHELESDLEPFKGLLLGLFFITVGASIDFGLLAASFLSILGMTIGLMALKAGVLLGLSRIYRIRGADKWLFSLGLSQAGEFGFVLLAFTVASAAMPPDVADQLLLVVALSMLLTPALFIFYDKAISPRFVEEQAGEPDEIDQHGSVLIAGNGRFGGIVNRMLRASGYETTVVDYSSAQLEMLRTFGLRVYFGDATRPDLLHAAKIDEAKVLVIAIDGREQITELARYVVQQYPEVTIVARAVDRPHVYELWAVGVRHVIRETFDSSVRAGRTAMEALGVHPFEAERRAKQFAREDRKGVAEMAQLYDPDLELHENKAYVAKAREMLEQTEKALRGEDRAFSAGTERGWSPPTLDDVDAEKRRDAAATRTPEP